jgi:hypothetical protein
MPTARKPPPKRKPAAAPAPPSPAKRRTRKPAIVPAETPPPDKPARRQPYVPTDRDRSQVSALTGLGIPQVQICALLGGISVSTLHRHYRPEIDTAAARAVARVAESLYNRALKGDVNAMKFFLENRARDQWSERVTVIDGGTEVDPATLSDADLDADIARLKRRPAVARALKATGTVH